eukprot:SAG22_NODE_243_length_14055_cov_3.073015_10_plen_345_part_00
MLEKFEPICTIREEAITAVIEADLRAALRRCFEIAAAPTGKVWSRELLAVLHVMADEAYDAVTAAELGRCGKQRLSSLLFTASPFILVFLCLCLPCHCPQPTADTFAFRVFEATVLAHTSSRARGGPPTPGGLHGGATAVDPAGVALDTATLQGAFLGRSSLLKAVITAFPSVSLPFLAVPLRSHRTVAISSQADRLVPAAEQEKIIAAVLQSVTAGGGLAGGDVGFFSIRGQMARLEAENQRREAARETQTNADLQTMIGAGTPVSAARVDNSPLASVGHCIGCFPCLLVDTTASCVIAEGLFALAPAHIAGDRRGASGATAGATRRGGVGDGTSAGAGSYNG